MEQVRDIFTPDQAAAYLQVNRETIYRFIRDGRLSASRLGRTYRIPRQSVERLLWSTRGAAGGSAGERRSGGASLVSNGSSGCGYPGLGMAVSVRP